MMGFHGHSNVVYAPQLMGSLEGAEHLRLFSGLNSLSFEYLQQMCWLGNGHLIGNSTFRPYGTASRKENWI